MTPRRRYLGIFVSWSLIWAMAVPASADEGLWLFNQFPKETLKQKYEVDIADTFLDNLRLSTVRVGGGSGAFVSGNGLILTSYRNAVRCSAVDSPCPGLDAAVLVAIEDVTKPVKDSVKE